MRKDISLATVMQEIRDAATSCALYGWVIDPPAQDALHFTVSMQSPADNEKYILEFNFENYPEQPYLIDFIHPVTREKGTRRCYPQCNDSFFHPHALICHPCNRGAYQNLHKDWTLSGWRTLAGGVKNLNLILDCIYGRISQDKTKYYGRMDK